MKKSYSNHLPFFFLLLFFQVAAGSQVKELNYEKEVDHSGIHVKSFESNQLEVTFSIGKAEMKTLQHNDQTFHTISMGGIFLPGKAGKPELPRLGRYIAVPKDAKAEARLSSYKYEILENVDIVPSMGIPLDQGERMALKKDSSVYNTNAFWPDKTVSLSSPQMIRGMDVYVFGISPFQYNPVTKELKVIYDMEIEITFDDGEGYWIDQRYMNPWWKPLFKDIILNYDQIPLQETGFDYKKDAEGYDYLIITLDDDDFVNWADSIRHFRVRQGIRTGIRSLSDIGGNSVSAITSYISDAYENWDIPPSAILLLGDYATDDQGIIAPQFPHEEAASGGTYITDNRYADMTGNYLPDIVISRITARNPDELEVMVNKFITHERAPSTNQTFYSKPIVSSGWQTDRWFQIAAEVVGGFWKHNLNKTPHRINNIFGGNPEEEDAWSSEEIGTDAVIEYFGEEGLGYIPDSPAELGGWRGGRALELNQAINAGSFMLLHRDHGQLRGWAQPYYRRSSLGSLHNSDLPFVLSINCLTGRFDADSESFTERFHRHAYGDSPAGALGLIAASHVSFSFVNDVYVWGFINHLWSDFLPDYGSERTESKKLTAFANAAAKYYLEQSGWPKNPEHKIPTYDLMHHHGDAFLNLYTEMPQEIQASFLRVMREDQQVFQFSADPYTNITLTYYCKDDQVPKILASGRASGNEDTLQLKPIPESVEEVLLTATKQNHFRLEKPIRIIPSDGPYITTDGYTISQLDKKVPSPGSHLSLEINFVNAGSRTAHHVKADLVTDDPYIASIENNIDVKVGDIEPGETKVPTDAFGVSLADSVPDQHIVSFYLQAEDETGKTYHDTLHLTAYASDIAIPEITLLNSHGQEMDFVQPGQDAHAHVTIENQGHWDSDSPVLWIDSESPYITFQIDSLPGTALSPGEKDSLVFDFSVSQHIPRGEQIALNAKVDDGRKTSKSFQMEIGDPMHFVLGSGDIDDQRYPFSNFHTSNRTQLLFRSEEFGVGSYFINGLSFDFHNASQSPSFQTLPNLLIRVKTTTKSSLDKDGFIDMEQTDTLLYEEMIEMPLTDGWFRFDIAPFEYQFGSNILLDIAWSNLRSTTRDWYRVNHTEYEQNLVLFGRSDDTYYPDYPRFSDRSNVRPNVKFHFTQMHPQKEKDVAVYTKDYISSSEVENALVTVGSKTVATGDEGLAQFELYQGNYQTKIKHEQYHAKEKSFAVTAEENSFTFFLDPVYQITFIVHDIYGNEIDDAVIAIDQQEFTPGEYIFDHFRPGSYNFRVMREAYYDKTGEFMLYDKYQKNIEVFLEPDGTNIDMAYTDVDFYVSPNPVNDLFYLYGPKDLGNKTFKLRDINGRVIKTLTPRNAHDAKHNRYKFHVDRVPAGVYFLVVKGDNSRDVIKLVIHG